jgi:hypothetical protein
VRETTVYKVFMIRDHDDEWEFDDHWTFDREDCERRAAEYNADAHDRQRRSYAKRVAEFEQKRAEWEALAAAGLREGEYPVPMPTEFQPWDQYVVREDLVLGEPPSAL